MVQIFKHLRTNKLTAEATQLTLATNNNNQLVSSGSHRVFRALMYLCRSVQLLILVPLV